jgi:hypothetical protein
MLRIAPQDEVVADAALEQPLILKSAVQTACPEQPLILRSAVQTARLEGQLLLRSNGRQIEGSGTVFGRSMVCPNQVFWIEAIVPSASTLRIAALTASISVLSSSRPTQEK